MLSDEFKDKILKYNAVELWKKPREGVEKEGLLSEMSEEDHRFLCGLLKKMRPQKIVEIGVAEGGTTAVIMNCLSLMGLESEVYSIDLNECLYLDNSKKTGYVYDEVRSYIKGNSTHKFMLGKTIAGYVDIIGEGIDFLIIDTTHWLPGEILDFLCVLPYLASNATVVLHDISLEYIRCLSEENEKILEAQKANATKILFSTVTGTKYFSLNGQHKSGYNIAAFSITDDTVKYIRDCFQILTMTWKYELPPNIVDEYRRIYVRHYNEECIKLFDIAVETNRIMRNKYILAEKDLYFDKMVRYATLSEAKIEQLKKAKNIIVYGAGIVAVEILKLLEKENIKILAVAVSNEDENVRRLCGVEVKEISKLLDYRDAMVVISSTSDVFVREMEKTLKEEKFENIMIVDRL